MRIPTRASSTSPMRASGTGAQSRYKSPSSIGRATLACMGMSVGGGFVSRFLEMITLSQGRHFAWIDTTEKVMAPLLGLIGVGAMITFCVWLYRTASNVGALGRRGLRSTPAHCVVWLFVPIANLFMPFLAVSQIAAASSDRGRAPLSVVVWWASYLVSVLVGFVTSAARRTAPPNAVWFLTTISTFMWGIALVALLILIPKIDRDQDARHVEMHAG